MIYAQGDQKTANMILKDSLVSRFNRRDFDGIYDLGTTPWKKKSKREAIKEWLNYIYGLTGPVLESKEYKQLAGASYYKWTGTRKTMSFSLKDSGGLFSDFNFTFLQEPVPAAEMKKMPTDNPLKSSLDSAVNVITTSFMVYNRLVGVSIGIVKDGKTYLYDYGTTEKGKQRLPGSHEVYELASITKAFTGILVAQAVIDKKFRLQDDCRKWQDGVFPNLAYHDQPIRIVHLANHTSGLLHELPDLSAYTSSFDVLKMYDSYTDQKFFDDLRKGTTHTVPGATYQYSNVGFKLLGIILERVYKMSYAKLVEKYITRPFGMKDTRPSLAISDTTSYMKGYDENGLVMPHNNFNMFGGSGALLSTSADMVSFIRHNISEKDPAIALSHQQTFGTSAQGIGLGWNINYGKYGKMVWKDGGALGFRSYCIVVPALRTGIVWLANKSGLGDELGMMIDELLDAVLKFSQ